MKQKAVVRSVFADYAMVEVARNSMCDGCVNQNCKSHTCAAGAMFGSAKTMTVRAKNPVGAAVGDTVWVETADSRVLGNAALVFLMPIAVCMLLYAVTDALFSADWIAYAAAAVGFVGAFGVLGLLEKKKKNEEPDIVITGIQHPMTSEPEAPTDAYEN